MKLFPSLSALWMNGPTRSGVWITVVAALSALLAIVSVQLFAPLQNLEKKLADIRVAALAVPQSPSDQIIVIALDEETVSQFAYRSPIDREFIANLITRIDTAGAKAIGVDVLIDQASDSAKDDRLYSAIRAVRTPLHFSFTSDSAFVTEPQLDYMRSFIPADMRMESRLLSDPFDGLVRRINPGGFVADGKIIYDDDHPPSFAAVMASYLDAPLPRRTREIAWRPLPSDGAEPIPVISANYVSYLPPEMFAGKVVLIGAVLSMTDRHPTPLSIIDDGDRGLMPGVLIQAHAIDSLVSGAPEPVSPPLLTLLLVGAFTALGVLISQLRKGLLFNVALSLISLAGYWVIAIAGYGYGIGMLPILMPSIAMLLSVWMMDLVIGRGERMQRQFIQSTFSRYVSPAVVDRIAADPNAAAISGEKRLATFLFTDVADFTTMSELLTPEDLSDVLNSYLDGACEIILRQGGTIDKFIGDAIMAIFNAPLDQPDHAAAAVRSALELDAYAERYRKECNARGIPIGVTRIGVHAGPAVVGNFGSSQRMDFTALGDTVNTAARTEGINKYFGTRICCTQSVVDQAPNQAFRTIGHFALKGKAEYTTLYTPLPAEHDEDAEEAYREAFALLEQHDEAARPRFAELHQEYPDDPLISYHHQRLKDGEVSARIKMGAK
jgi:class 3 adenylate cyclase/CHASE2 domain-containing sensor protein